ncbi:hypothetical protein [Wolbachia pipientis]|uniref:Uncharacterized protein n=1 Tax=Wolbachia pipientis TaxID=955 RepID=A0A7G5CCV4_WOLPI|nr:hypothetical protein [Wolbachia pipientis]QMV47038.1 hypothetical protein HC356_03085 [Wolbachia pipientis]
MSSQYSFLVIRVAPFLSSQCPDTGSFFLDSSVTRWNDSSSTSYRRAANK